ncbi:MAG TPA: DUF5946 family protein [Gammaproteobacteria bacterium]|nr:DUF5946 family protein [Gammaproteobacteria bacterium]
MIKCMGCGGSFADIQGPTHRYMESCSGCWAIYGEVLAREYSDPAYFQVHKLTVDAYAVQHPGQPSPQSIQSVAVHLIRLYLILETGVGMQRANDAIKAAADTRTYTWLTPPASMGSMAVSDVHEAKDVNEHTQRVRAWAESAWSAWSPHHATIRAWQPEGF